LPGNITVVDTTSQGAKITWNHTTGSNYELEWGAPGFTPGTGILENVIDTNSFTFRGLAPLTTYAFILRKVCGTNFNSSYSPIYTFRTLDPSSVKSLKALNFTLFPNPAQGNTSLVLSSSSAAQITLINNVGTELLKLQTSNTESIPLALTGLASGTYFVKVSQGDSFGVKTLIIK
jgi:hypothetical protein